MHQFCVIEYLTLHWPIWLRCLLCAGSGGKTTVGGLLGTTPMYFRASHAVEPVATVGALHSTMVFMHRLQLFSSAFVPCSVTLRKHLLHSRHCSWLCDWTVHVWLLLVTMLQPLVVGLMPASPGEGFIIPPLFWDPHSLQTSANQVSPSPLGSPWWACLGQPSKECLLWVVVVRYSGQVLKPLKSALCHLGCCCLQVSPLLSCHL